MLTAVGEGEVTITASVRGTNLEATSTFNVADIHVTSISIASGYNYRMEIGDTQQLTATVSPDNAKNKNVIWTSSDKNVLTVSETGLVTAVGYGTAKITVTTEDQTNASAGYTLTASTYNITVASVYVDRIEWQTKPKLEMAVGDTQQLAVILYPDNATNKTVTWASSDTKVLNVSQDGLVTAIGEGRAWITATAEGSDPDWKESVSTVIEVVKESLDWKSVV